MGPLLDSTFLIVAERRSQSPADLLRSLETSGQLHRPAMSVISVMELAHGEARADSAERAARRELFLDELLEVVEVVPVSRSIARSAGRLDGLLQRQGQKLAFPDLLIAATALEAGRAIVTGNLRHFNRIPGLNVIHHQG